MENVDEDHGKSWKSHGNCWLLKSGDLNHVNAIYTVGRQVVKCSDLEHVECDS